jgi:hypothetical protein
MSELHEQSMGFAPIKFSGIAQVLLIFHCNIAISIPGLQYCIAIPIPGLQYCIAIQNSKTYSSLSLNSLARPITILVIGLDGKLGCKSFVDL